MPGPLSPRVALGLVAAARRRRPSRGLSGDGLAPPARRVKPVETSLPPITVDFRDVAAEAGLTAANVSGGEGAKKYILETTGSGVAVARLRRRRTGWTSSSRTGRLSTVTAAGAKATSHLYRNLGRPEVPGRHGEGGPRAHGMGPGRLRGGLRQRRRRRSLRRLLRPQRALSQRGRRAASSRPRTRRACAPRSRAGTPAAPGSTTTSTASSTSSSRAISSSIARRCRSPARAATASGRAFP